MMIQYANLTEIAASIVSTTSNIFALEWALQWHIDSRFGIPSSWRIAGAKAAGSTEVMTATIGIDIGRGDSRFFFCNGPLNTMRKSASVTLIPCSDTLLPRTKTILEGLAIPRRSEG